MSPLTEARKRANKKWNSENLTSFTVKLNKKDTEEFRQAATAAGKTPTTLLREYIKQFVQLHQEEQQKTEE